MFGYLFSPLAWLMGIDAAYLLPAGQVIGEKTILNEFYAYLTLGKLKTDGVLPDSRTVVILTYALCGFSNFSSIGILIGGIGALAPNRRDDLARLGLRAMIAGTMANLMSATIVGMLL